MNQKQISLGVTDLSFHRVTGSLLAHVLTDMGFEVSRHYAPHQENFMHLEQGKVDLLTSAWLPSSHGEYKAQVEKVVPLIELGLHYQPYALWGVPDYVPAEDVEQVSDLLKPEVKAKMNPIIQGIGPGAGITRFSIEMMDAYGLNSAGYRFLTGTQDDCIQAFEQAVNNGDWAVVPLWQPQFLHHQYKIREIREPKGLLGVVDRAVLLLRGDKKHLFTEPQLNVLDNLQFSNEIISKLDYLVSQRGEALDLVTRNWLDTVYYPNQSMETVNE